MLFKRTKIEEGEYTTKYEEHQLNSIRAKLVWIDDRFTLEQNTKTKKHYGMSCLQNFTTEEILSSHKKQCLLINGCQGVNYKLAIIKFANYNKQTPILFKIYGDTECFLKRTKIEEGNIQQNIKNINLIL